MHQHAAHLVVGHEGGVGNRDERQAQAQRLEEAAGAGVADDQRGARHQRTERGPVAKALHGQPVGQARPAGALRQDVAGGVRAGSDLPACRGWSVWEVA